MAPATTSARAPGPRIAGPRIPRLARLGTMVVVAALAVGAARPAATQTIDLEPIASGLARPVDIAHAGDGSGRLFIVLQSGRILIHDGGQVLSTPFLDIAPLVLCCGERGLLGVAFHPDYAVNGLFYVNYNDRSGDTVIARYQVSADPDVADPASAAILLTIDQPFSNHNGGQLHFGPDGYLYIASGDGGSGGDPGNRAQNLGTLLGKMLRIDVDGGTPYAIPPDNPFFDDADALPEIWAYGLRNPFRFSFDRLTGDVFIGDVGQGRREEIDFQPAASPGGENYGWRLMEGNLCFDPPTNCNDGTLVLPILDYAHTDGNCSVTGGYRYRGGVYPRLAGVYFYADFCTGRIWGASEQADGSWTTEELLDSENRFSSFGEDEDGELYIAHLNDTNGIVYRILADRVRAADAEIVRGFRTVSLGASFADPVVIAGPPTSHGGEGGVVRLRNVASDSFEARFQEWQYLDGAHAPEDISYLVLERGRQVMADGSVWEAGDFPLGGTGNWQMEAFTEAFAGPPALFLTVQTHNGSQPVMVKARNVTASGFDAALFEEEDLMDGHVVETVSYLAVYSASGAGTLAVGGETRPYRLQTVTADQKFVPVLSSTLNVREEQSLDPETAHAAETVSVLGLGAQLFAQIVSDRERDTAALRRRAPEYAAPLEWGVVDGVGVGWTVVPLAKAFTNPVVVAKPVSRRGSQPGVVRTRNVGERSFELRFQEWLYLDGNHLPEQVFYLVAEAGSSDMRHLTVEAGTLSVVGLLGGGFDTVGFASAFTGVPAVFTGVMTFNGSDPVITRVADVTADGFLLAMDEEEDKRDGHTAETLGWIAIERGEVTTSDRRLVTVSEATAYDAWRWKRFAPPGSGIVTYWRFPVFLSDVTSTLEDDPVVLRYRNLKPTGVLLHLQEEQSLDSETDHATESISLFVAY